MDRRGILVVAGLVGVGADRGPAQAPAADPVVYHLLASGRFDPVTPPRLDSR
ncbi:MAG TPA: hypothetical protein VE091_01130 [Gemmatimonadales bacterium]|nr:hypothetical protein [Gemmatimonadales bacterium]